MLLTGADEGCHQSWDEGEPGRPTALHIALFFQKEHGSLQNKNKLVARHETLKLDWAGAASVGVGGLASPGTCGLTGKRGVDG